MSRTYRKTRYRHFFHDGNPFEDYFLKADEIVWDEVDKVEVSRFSWIDPRYDVVYAKNSRTGKKKLAKYLSDAGTHNFKEPGPHWFRNLYSDRPLRRKGAREIQKFMQNNEYEPMIDEMPKLPYWT